MSNPFFYGNPVPLELFLNRWRQLSRSKSRIVNQGQSTAIIGEPRSGKTSLLMYLEHDLKSEARLVFSYLDTYMLSESSTLVQFWERTLQPLYDRAVASAPNTDLAEAYRICQVNAFGTFVLERLFNQMRADKWRLVLMLDEFDSLLYHPLLNRAEFFGSLRSLTTRSQGALALIIASRRSPASLNEATRQFSRTGSPYFNFLNEITLEPFPDKDVTTLLSRAGDRFSLTDHHFIKAVAGGHPYLLQVAGSALWEAYEDGQVDPIQRWQQTGEHLYDEASLTLGDTWQLWSPIMRRAIMAAALPQMTLKQHQFHKERLISDLRDFGPELRSLEKQGFVIEDAKAPSGWRVRPRACVWWLADELVKTVRDDPSLETWLRTQEWEGLVTAGEKTQLGQVVGTVTGMLKDGAATLIEAAAKGLGTTMIKGGQP